MSCPRDRLPHPLRDEAALARTLSLALQDSLEWRNVLALAQPWVEAVRAHPAPFWALESLLHEDPISGAEGLALMRLAEALLRIPDTDTALALTADQLGHAHFDQAPEQHTLPVRLAGQALEWSKRLLPQVGDATTAHGLWHRLGAQTVMAATLRALQLLGQQFVLGMDIEAALNRGQPSPSTLYSFDMLGEGARCEADALRYLAAYQRAVSAIARHETSKPLDPTQRHGLSVKLSALYPRYEAAHAEQVHAVLLPRLMTLVEAASQDALNLTLDAEESERLELSLEVLEAVATQVQARHPSWGGLGLAVQAYQTRALAVIDAVDQIAQRSGLRLMVRLVKGAYWDSEIKRAQELGLAGYPVWTHKHHTDLAYLACARALLATAGRLYPQFATHNAATLAAVMRLGQAAGQPFELQRLHGMGEAIYREVQRQQSSQRPTPLPAAPVRVYAPVGHHRDLLAYLVRRLLENGANSAFVHRLADPRVAPDVLLAAPWGSVDQPGVLLPSQCYGPTRRNARGLDLCCAADRADLEASLWNEPAPAPAHAGGISQAELGMDSLALAFPGWAATPLPERCATLRRAADALEQALPRFVGFLVREGGKTLGDALAEVREAIDFCRYYAAQAQEQLAPHTLPGPTGERNELRCTGRGVFVCISPWNFPLAIFTGQVVAALVAGNSVAAKPAEQTPATARAMVALLHAAGVPAQALQLFCGPGETVGAALVRHPACAGVAFTGSTAVAKHIQRSLAASDGPIVPLIAETGGLNAMVVDSSALPEQVVDAVLQSAFRSAGQRCSALRLLCVHEAIAEPLIERLGGAMHSLVVGEASHWSTDVGPVIDAAAHAQLSQHIDRLTREAHLLARTPMDARWQHTHIAPVAFEITQVSQLRCEVFGPVLHVLRWQGAVETLIDQINALGYGLTLGVQTRIDSRAQAIAARARVGNVYINRNMVGAVVGVQPFGGMGLSGTGPKAGGPHYLVRFCAEQTLSTNTAAAGGNVDLMAGR